MNCIKHASRGPCNHHVGLIPAQHDANTIYSLFKLMPLDKVKTTEGIQLKAAARTTSAVSCNKQDQQCEDQIQQSINSLTPNDHYSGRTAPLTSKRCILYIYSTNKGTEYFKHGIYSPSFFSSKCSLFHNSNVFGSCIIHILCTECAKIKKK